MPTKFFSSASAAIKGRTAQQFKDFCTWLRTYSPIVSENLQNEAHLVGNDYFGNPAEFTRFLRKCSVDCTRDANDQDRMSTYEHLCSMNALKGLSIPQSHLPKTLHRYCSSRSLAEDLIERVLGIDARINFTRTKTPSWGEAFAQLQSNWEPTL